MQWRALNRITYVNVVGGGFKHFVLGAVEDVDGSELALGVSVLSGLRFKDDVWKGRGVVRRRRAIYQQKEEKKRHGKREKSGEVFHSSNTLFGGIVSKSATAKYHYE